MKPLLKLRLVSYHFECYEQNDVNNILFLTHLIYVFVNKTL